MASIFSRHRFATAVAGAFVGGLVLTAALDLTPFGYAQQTNAPRPSPAAVQSLSETGEAFVAIAEHVTPAVVSIAAESDRRTNRRRQQLPPGWEDFLRQFGGGQERSLPPTPSMGTGFIVSRDGYILTNNHVVEGADRLIVRLNDGRSFRARQVGRDPDTDIALIKIDGSNFPSVTLGDDTRLRVGEWVVAIGNPLGLNFTVTAGIVSAKGRGAQELPLPNLGDYAIVDLIQTDAAINPGNSGGPLVNIRGEVVGINNAIASQTGYFAGYGFAIPVTLARDVMEDLIKYGRVRRAVIGVSIREVNADDAAVAGLREIRGAVIGDLTEDSPAGRAGLQPNDIIVAVNGRAVDRVSTLQRVVRSHQPGETVTVDVMRYGEQRSFRVRLDEAQPRERPTVAEGGGPRDEEGRDVAGVAAEKIGIVVQPVTQEWARARQLDRVPDGVLVLEVLPDGPAREKLSPGSDVIEEIVFPAPRRPIRNVADLQQALQRLRPGDYVSLGVYNSVTDRRNVVNLRIGGS